MRSTVALIVAVFATGAIQSCAAIARQPASPASSTSTAQSSSASPEGSDQSIEEQAMRLSLRDMSPGQRADALADYLHNHRLPLVGVQFTNAGNGARQVVLYGYVATEFGKSDAEKKVRAILDDPNVTVVNRIQVRPEIASMGGSGSSNSSAAASQPNDLQAYQNQQGLQQYQNQQALQQYQQQQANNWMSLMLPLLGFGFGGGNSYFSFGGSPSPYGAPYSPYSPYAQPDPFFGPGAPSSPYP